jgi:hypothetical protein
MQTNRVPNFQLLSKNYPQHQLAEESYRLLAEPILEKVRNGHLNKTKAKFDIAKKLGISPAALPGPLREAVNQAEIEAHRRFQNFGQQMETVRVARLRQENLMEQDNLLVIQEVASDSMQSHAYLEID